MFPPTSGDLVENKIFSNFAIIVPRYILCQGKCILRWFFFIYFTLCHQTKQISQGSFIMQKNSWIIQSFCCEQVYRSFKNLVTCWGIKKLENFLHFENLLCLQLVIYRMVTSSSEDVGCMATQSSNCAFVAPILMATPNPWSISSHPWPTMWSPITLRYKK